MRDPAKRNSTGAAALGALCLASCAHLAKPAPPVPERLVIYSPAPVSTMLHAHNVEFGERLLACGVAQQVEVPAIALPDSINGIHALDVGEKPYHLPIVTTLDFMPALTGGAPDWHVYAPLNPDLKFVAPLYEVAFGVLSDDPGILTPGDLVGKRIAVPARPSSVRWFTEVLLRDGWGILDQVELVEMPPPAVAQAMSSGAVDATTWNFMSLTPAGFQPLLPGMLASPSVHWLDVDAGTLERIRAANFFVTDRVAISENVGGRSGDTPTHLLSFAQGLAAWDTTPGALVAEIAACLASSADGGEQLTGWPGLAPSMVHPALRPEQR